MSAATTDRITANLATVTEIYAAFGSGAVSAILDKIAPDCRWETWADHRAQQAGVPWLQPQTGPAGVANFFTVLAELEIHDFEVLDVLGNERQVAAEVVIEFTTPAGGRARDEEVHLWTLDEQQRVVRLRHYVDTAKHIAAFAGTDVSGAPQAQRRA